MNNHSPHLKSQSIPLQQIYSRIYLYHQQCKKIRLTPREQELLEWLSFGYSYQEIATGINISVNTVKKYFFQLREKFDVDNNNHLLCIVFRGGLLPTINPPEFSEN